MLTIPCRYSEQHAISCRTAVRLGVSSLSGYTKTAGYGKMPPESSDPEASDQSETKARIQFRNNQRMLDLRQQVELQERIIRSLISEKDSLTKELDSRLFLVEAQLRREQKHIEEVLSEKEQLIQFQAMQIHSLKQLLSQAPRNYRSSARRLLSKRYSVALDEYMKDHCVVSRALPVMVQAENEESNHRICSRTKSLPELRFKGNESQQRGCCHGVYHQGDAFSSIHHSPEDFYSNNLDPSCQECCRILSQEVLDDIRNRRWTSDCDSENSDSLDSGISSPSIQTKSLHDYIESAIPRDVYVGNHNGLGSSGRSDMKSSFDGDRRRTLGSSERVDLDPIGHKPRRSSSIGNFIQRTFSSSEKPKDCLEARRHHSFSEAVSKEVPLTDNPPRKEKFISCANRTFGTNHRSVTKPRDVKFRKLFKFRRRQTEPEIAAAEDYMTV